MKLSDTVQSFLHAAGWRRTSIARLPADFSSRRFTRVTRGDQSAILMQAARDQKTLQFIEIAKLLRDCGLSAPHIFAADDESGLVLMEDLGDRPLGKLLDEGQDPLPLYRRAVDVLIHLHKITSSRTICNSPAHPSRHTGDLSRRSAAKAESRYPSPVLSAQASSHALLIAATNFNLPHFTAESFAAQTELFLDFYFPHKHNRLATKKDRDSFREAWLSALKPIDKLPQSLMLRDYMPDNLMNLPRRQAHKSIGLLDFQDGGLGPIAYDLASLCENVRRSAAPKLLDDMTAYYHKHNPVMPLKDLKTACRILSAQRHTRILGIITRLAKQGRPEKLAYIPRVTAHLTKLCRFDELATVRKWMEKIREPVH